jgi:hypothetical protein
MTRRRVVVPLAVAAAAVAVLAGASAIATAAGSDAASPSSFMQSLAKHLGISTDKLQDAAKAAAIDQIDALLADGKITKEQADAAKERVNSGDGPLLFFGPRFRGGDPDRGPGPRFGFHHHFGRDLLGAAADYLGVTEAQLHEQLRSGKSLAQIAKDGGKSTDGLKKALHDAVKTDLDAAVKAGDITQARADEALDRFDEHVDDLITRTPGERPRLERLHAPGFIF